MKQPDRTQAPAIHPFGALSLPQPSAEVLPNGIELYTINKGSEAVCRIDMLFDGGRFAAHVPAVADLCGPMMRRGIPGSDADRIAEALDFYGAWLQTGTTLHYSTLSLFSLNRNLARVLPLLTAIISAPTFPESDLRLLVGQRIQQLRINSGKVRIVAGEEFNRLVFGKDHPYARVSTADDFDNLQVADLQAYHHRYYLNTRLRVVLAGCITADVARLVREFLCALPCHTTSSTATAPPLLPQDKHLSLIDRQGSLQSGIRMGMPTIGCSHDDFPLLGMANLILGGYFGSRLMTNVREEKGYTYGISSYIISLQQGAYLTIMTETGTEYTRSLIDEVRKELQRLGEEDVPADELETARSYMQGRHARISDSPFSLSDYYISSMVSGTPFDYFAREDTAIRTATAADIRRVTAQYLPAEKLYTAIAGDKSLIGL